MPVILYTVGLIVFGEPVTGATDGWSVAGATDGWSVTGDFEVGFLDGARLVPPEGF